MPEKKAESYSQDDSTQNVVDLLTSILEQFRAQAQHRTPPPIPESAKIAISAFREISEALDTKPNYNYKASK